MSKRLIITQEQLERVIGLDEAFLGYATNGGKQPGGNDITSADGAQIDGEGDSFLDDSEPYLSSKFDDETKTDRYGTPDHLSSFRSGLVSMAEGKKKIQEHNAALKNLNVYATVIYDDPNIPDEKYSGSEDAQEMRRLRAQRSGNTKKAKAIDTALDQRRKPIENSKKYKKDILHQTNAYQKPGGKKMGKGTAHTAKNDNNIFNV